MTRHRVQFAHGLETGPQGNKARLFAQHFEALTPAMNTADFAGCVQQHAQLLGNFRPDLLIGSSFGGAVAVALLDRGLWTGPTLLLAQAARLYDPAARLPADARVWLVHGRGDDVVPIEHSRELAATGTPERIELVEVDDDHGLTGMLKTGALLALVERVLAARA